MDWSKAISWRSELTLAGINTAKQYPDWPAKLDGKITTRGSLRRKLAAQRAAAGAEGQCEAERGERRRLANRQQLQPVENPGINIALGRNHLDVKGELGDALNLDASVDAPHLDNALPGLGGVAKGTIKARGTLQAQLLADLTASGLRWQQLQIRRVTLQSDVKSSDRSPVNCSCA